jgi:cell shape-determining protein MreC
MNTRAYRVYLPQHTYLLIAVGLTLLYCFLEIFGLLWPLRAFGEWALSPAISFVSQVVFIAETPYQMSVGNAKNYAYVQDLELRYAEAVAKADQLDALKKENAELKQVIEKNPPSSASNISATHGANGTTGDVVADEKIIVAPILSYAQPYIGKGSRDGVSEGALVFIANTLIGRVGKVSESQAELILLQESISQPVLARTESGATGVLKGNGKDVVLTELPADQEVQIGEQVMSVGQVGVAPVIAIGRVKAVGVQAGSSTKTATVDQVVSFFSSHIVEVKAGDQTQ